MPYLRNLIYVCDDDVVSDSLWALSFISDSYEEPIDLLLENVSLQRVVKLLGHPKESIKVPALRIIGNICTGTPSQIEEVLGCRCLEALYELLGLPPSLQTIVKETCWALSNIAAGPMQHIEELIKAGLMKRLSELVISSTDYEVGHTAES